MNRKIFLGVAVVVLVTILGGILLVGPTMVIAPQGETPVETLGITKKITIWKRTKRISNRRYQAKGAGRYDCR